MSPPRPAGGPRLPGVPNFACHLFWSTILVAAFGLAPACQDDGGCIGGEPNCQVAAPCPTVTFPGTCADSSLELRTLAQGDKVPGGLDALGARGDVLIGNGMAVAVIAGLGDQNYLDPGGGSILDLTVRGQDDDSLNQILQVVGILPRDAAHYTALKLIDERPARVAIQVQGTLDSVPGAAIYTLYEMRPCEPGLRVRTELVNGTADQQLYALGDGYYWSKREALPFTPTVNTGFNHPDFTLLTINDAYQSTPFMAASGHGPPAASYSVVGCNQDLLEGFQSESVSALGLPRTVVPPREYQIYERFFAVAARGDVAGAGDIAEGVRARLRGEQTLVLSGMVDGLPGAGVSEREASLLISAGRLLTPLSERTPLTQVVPTPDGRFSAVVPAANDYVIELHSFGRKVAEREVLTVAGDRDIGALTLPVVARLTATVKDATGQPLDAEVFVVPADDTTTLATTGSLHGQFETCAPWLGPPPGQSPACNRFLVPAGKMSGPVEIPPGNYYFYAFHGPFYSLARQTLNLGPGDSTIDFTLTSLPLLPPGAVSADLHVHGAASFDSSIPELDRVLSFAAANVDVIVATDHDVAHDYSATVAQLGLTAKLSTIVGVETTGHIPFLYAPDDSFPLVIGHYNFWPIRYQPGLPRLGAPFDELQEPGELLDHTEPLYTDPTIAIMQLNHPWADPQFGRDLGFPRAIGINALHDLPDHDDGTANGLYVRAPVPGGHHNNDHQTQEVMNGGKNEQLLAYRQFWFWGLNQGQIKTGTANSDSHGLTDDTAGSPRNVVYAGTQAGPNFDVTRFNQALRDGNSFGTNGPLIVATVDTDAGEASFGLALVKPSKSGKLHLEVAAAPWVPVDEIRIVVNGAVVKKIAGALLTHPADPFGTTGLLRYQGDVLLSDLLPSTGDAWLVVEAGFPLPLAADLGGGPNGAPDGIPDTGDNNGDGKVDATDIAAGKTYGPLKDPDPPKNDSDPRFHFAQVVTQSYPMSFTNPFVLDLDGDGKFTPPRTVVPQPDGSLGLQSTRPAKKGGR